MTFSVLATDGSGGVGLAVTSSSPAVAARCTHLRAGVGGAASQNVTDPRLGTSLLDTLESGLSADAAMATVVDGRQHIEHRQLTVMSLDGRSAAHSGSATLGVHHDRIGTDVVAAGNLLADTRVIDTVVDAFEVSSGELENRLLEALAAGLSAGGEAGPLHSAGLAVVREVDWPETDLRVDWSDDPVGDLRRLLELWLPQRDDYVTRGLDPTTAPSYGVPGDE